MSICADTISTGRPARLRSDFELLDAWKAGDATAGNRLFQRHYQALFRFFRNKVGDEAEELVQQTLLACVRTASRFEKRSSFRSYLYCAARSKLYDHWRRRVVRPDMGDGVTQLPDPSPTPSGMERSPT